MIVNKIKKKQTKKKNLRKKKKRKMDLLENNLTNDSSDTTLYDLEEYLTNAGSTWFWDSVFLFVMPPIGTLGFLTNILSVYVFCTKEFRSIKLYQLLAFYSMTSAITSFFVIFDFYFYSRRYLWIANTFSAYFYNVYIHEFVFEFVFNIITIYYLRNYVERRSNMIGRRVMPNEMSMNESRSMAVTMNVKLSGSGSAGQKRASRSSKPSKVDKRASVMVSVMSVLSTLEHLTLIVSILYGNFTSDPLSETLGRTADVAITLKQASNFFVFFYFNNHFKKYLRDNFRFFKLIEC